MAGCNAKLGEDDSVSALIKTADSAVVERKYTKPGSDQYYLRILSYGQLETRQLASALLIAGRDRGSCPEPLNTVKFYCKSEPVAKIETRSGVFIYLDKQYRSASQVLPELVDAALEAAPEMEVKALQR